ncbi:helix-turn-helix domain-containing protein [Arenibacter certesii]|uniref:Transcriptional regulator n=1 Tax=Arenibacter certesii TaxID=228955 RepID=A0A918IQ16_9FLAO|nr:helix-turn-helix transcriptional regulator [Arenibacter certesii]GGW25798.1 transcriptional regulator [Arenibacter certesii]
MINNLDFIKRIERILKFYDLSASIFADKIGVQRSSISHLLSGRNKPSLDFVMRTAEAFPEVDLYWLLYGKGSFPHKPKSPSPTVTPTSGSITTEAKKTAPSGAGTVEKIIIFYRDGSFKAYTEK